MKTQMCLVFMSKLIKLKDNNFSLVLSYNTLKLFFYSNMTPNPVFNGRNGFSILKNSYFYMSHLYIGQKTKKLFKNWKNGGLWRPSWISSDGHKMKTYYPIWKKKTSFDHVFLSLLILIQEWDHFHKNRNFIFLEHATLLGGPSGGLRHP